MDIHDKIDELVKFLMEIYYNQNMEKIENIIIKNLKNSIEYKNISINITKKFNRILQDIDSSFRQKLDILTEKIKSLILHHSPTHNDKLNNLKNYYSATYSAMNFKKKNAILLRKNIILNKQNFFIQNNLTISKINFFNHSHFFQNFKLSLHQSHFNFWSQHAHKIFQDLDNYIIFVKDKWL